MTTLKERYQKEILPALMKEHGITNVLAVPVPSKVTVNMGLGEALKDKGLIEMFSKDIEKITSVKPGITGLWQVQPSRHTMTFNERVEMDKEYIKNKTFVEDIKIIFRTIKVVINREGS